MPDPSSPSVRADAAVGAVRAPGRVNLIGDHTDYNAGLCLPMAIDRSCTAAWRPRDDGRCRARSRELDGTVDLAADGSDDPRRVEPAWGRFLAGVLRLRRDTARAPVPLDLEIDSTVPVGAGLSSSSALSVACTLALATAAGEPPMDPREVARAALDAEVLATGVPGGLMDQLCSVLGVEGHALLLDCRTLEATPVAVPNELAVVVVHSGVTRTLTGSEYGARRAACDAAAVRLGVGALRDVTLEDVRDDPIARHVVTENQRVLDAVAALRARRFADLGTLLLASHASLRDDYRVSTPELDRLVELLVERGAYGARLTGAGFGGCVVALTPTATGLDGVESAADRYREETRLAPVVIAVRAVAGAGPAPVEAWP